jgi:hypothetical protein
LRRGRWIDVTRADEVLASEIFCDAHGFNPGDRVTAIINGRRRSLTIVGVALSPEYVYAIRPGAIFPDKRQFGIFWMSRRALGSAFNMEGGFNDVSIAIARGANVTDVISGSMACSPHTAALARSRDPFRHPPGCSTTSFDSCRHSASSRRPFSWALRPSS